MKTYSRSVRVLTTQQYRDQKDAILFLVHVSASMVKTSAEEGKSALKTALECAYELLLQKIISNPNDMMGIILFGTVDTLSVPR
jgi:ATP-dependent DNA helicase 2 subunit 1